MDEGNNKAADPFRSGSAASRHRLDSGSAARPMTDAMSTKPAIDGPRADSSRAGQETNSINGHPVDRLLCDNLDFGGALQLIKAGERVARRGWNGKGQYVALAHGGEAYGRSIGTRKPMSGFLVLHNVDGDLWMWFPSTADLLSNDWCLVREVPTLVYGSGAER